MKVCKVCKVENKKGDYYKSKRHKDGLFSECKTCHKIKIKKREHDNPESLLKKKKYQENYRKENKEKSKDYASNYYRTNKDVFSKRSKEYRSTNKEKIKDQKNKWVSKNKEHVQNYHKKWVDDNPVSRKEHSKTYRQKESSKSNSLYHANKRRADKINATPKWTDLGKVKILYEKAKWLESLTGLKYHVDHIIPLKGKNVCGLHIWENLQILEASLNCSKGNK